MQITEGFGWFSDKLDWTIGNKTFWKPAINGDWVRLLILMPESDSGIASLADIIDGVLLLDYGESIGDEVVGYISRC